MFYCDRLSIIVIIGRKIAITIVPTMPPRKMIMSGSSMLISWSV